MSAPDYTLEPNADGGFVVKVGGEVAGYLSEDAGRPGLWILEDLDGKITGRSELREKAAAFLAEWFVAEESDWI